MKQKITNRLTSNPLTKFVRLSRGKLDKIEQSLSLIEKQNQELLFAGIFRDSIQSSDWLVNKSFSPYRAAANYSLLYKLFRIYDVYKPKNVLEFGLGQTTHLTAQYIKAHSKIKAFVIDNDDEWVAMYKSKEKGLPNLNICKLPLKDFKKGDIHQKDAEYGGINSVIGNNKFNLVIVDGPIGYDKVYPRTNIVSLVDRLANDWIVIFDDAERPGEQRTVGLFRSELDKKNIKYGEFKVDALKTQHFVCSDSLKVMAEHI